MLTITEYGIGLQVHKPILFTTFPGFYLRNALVKALTVHCREPGRVNDYVVSGCQGCGRATSCLYRKLNLPVEKPEGIPGPMPFSLDVSMLHTGKYESGVLQFGIILYGRAQHYLPLFIKAMESVGRDYGLGEEGKAGQFSIIDEFKGSRIFTLSLSKGKDSRIFTLSLSKGKDSTIQGFKDFYPGPVEWERFNPDRWSGGSDSYRNETIQSAGFNDSTIQEIVGEENKVSDSGISDEGTIKMGAFAALNENPDTGISEITLRFSHLKLPQARLYARIHLPFDYLLQSILSRLQSLSETYGNGPATFPYPELLPADAGNIKSEERFAICNYQYTGTGKGHWFLSGDVKYSGMIAPYLSQIHLGSQLGIGRFTSYGFGRFELVNGLSLH